MKPIKILVFLLLPVFGFAQAGTITELKPSDYGVTERKTEETPKEDNNIYNTAGIEIKPDYPGGMQEFYRYVGKEYRVPKVKDLQGKIFVTFIVEKDGSITNVKVLRDIGFGTGDEAIRVLENSPNWIPGQLNGKTVRVLYSLPISIQPR